MSLFFVYAVNVRLKINLSIENFIFLKIIDFNQILFAIKQPDHVAAHTPFVSPLPAGYGRRGSSRGL